MFDRTILAFGSESGNAAHLAKDLATRLQETSKECSCGDLNNLHLASLDADDLLLVITSTFGDGDPPGNARAFAEQLSKISSVSPFQYAVFGIGDVSYPQFCRFGQAVDASLYEKGARRLVNRVDADLDYQSFFTVWESCLSDIIAGKKRDGLDLSLRVEAYSESRPYLARVNHIEPLPSPSGDVYNVNLDIQNSGIYYRAGDLLHLLPGDDAALYSELADWFGDDGDVSPLAGKELRVLGKSLLRGLANASNNSVLKQNLKFKNKSTLAEYLYGRDLLDVLQDCGNPGFISIEELAALLPMRSARPYLIASCGVTEGGSRDSVDICIRRVAYSKSDRHYRGSASHALCQAQAGDSFQVFVRSNPEFWLDQTQSGPVLMIGSDTGISAHVGLLHALENSSIKREAILVVDSTSEHPYESKLTAWIQKGVLKVVKTTSTADLEAENQVAQALFDSASDIYQMIEHQAHIYICGQKRSLDTPIDQSLRTIMQQQGNFSEVQAQDRLQKIYAEKRIHKILY
ncbi:MAG: flavodoxin domain-containing protein [Cyanobacteria bacterium P01_F01_bin.42]